MDQRRPIVVPLDGSSVAATALPVAVRLAQLMKAPVHMVHAVEEDEIRKPSDLETAREAFANYAAGKARELGLADTDFSVTVTAGPAAKVVLEQCWDARMVVLASHGRSGLKATLIGSVADKIVRGATKPVLVVPLNGRKALDGRPIVVGLDGSPAAEEGLTAARDLAELTSARVVLVRAYSMPPPVGIEFAAYPVDLADTMKASSEEYLGATAREGEESYAVFAPAPQAIAEVAAKVDAGLIVLTSHGKGLAQRIALGSTTDRAMHSMDRPLLIVPVSDSSEK